MSVWTSIRDTLVSPILGSPGKTQQTASNELTWGLPPQGDMMTYAQNYLQNALQQGSPQLRPLSVGQQGMVNPNAGYTPFTQLGLQLSQQQPNAQSYMGPYANQLQQGSLTNPLQQSMGTALQQYTNPQGSPVAQNLFGALQNVLQQDYQQNQIPMLQSMGGKYGVTGSSGQAHEAGNMEKNYQNTLASAFANIMGQQQQLGQQQLLGGTNALTSGASQAGNLGLGQGQLNLSQLLGQGNLGLGAGQLEMQRGLGTGQMNLANQLGLGNLGLSQYQTQLQGWQTPLAIALGLGGMTPGAVQTGGNITGASTMNQGYQGVLGQLAGAGAGALIKALA